MLVYEQSAIVYANCPAFLATKNLKCHTSCFMYLKSCCKEMGAQVSKSFKVVCPVVKLDNLTRRDENFLKRVAHNVNHPLSNMTMTNGNNLNTQLSRLLEKVESTRTLPL